jgi:DNA polymerase I-like protein with 3'-5' exonuclease and polymerase domains
MLKGGLFIDSKGREHSIYIVESANYSRTDICVPGAQYHVEPDKVEFSIVKRRKIYIYGDASLHSEMNDLMNTLKFAKLESNAPETDWIDGKFVQKITRGKNNEFFQEITTVNGRIENETYVHNRMMLNMFIISHDMSMAMDPINRDEYEELELHSDVVTSSSPYVPVSVLKTRFNLSWLDDRDYEVIKDVEEARRLLQSMDDNVDHEVQIGIDTETTGLEFNLYSKEIMVGVIVSPREKVSWYFPFAHKKFDNLPMDFLEEISVRMRVTTRRKVAHNKKFEKKVFMKCGVVVPIEDDSMQVSILANPIIAKGAHSLKHLMGEVSGEKFLEFEDIFLDKQNINFADLDEETVRVYACPDSDNTREVFKAKWEDLPVFTREIYSIEAELADLKAEQEYWGFRVDTKKFMEGYTTCDYVIKLLEKMIHTITRSEFKVSSNDQLIELLYNRMKCPIYVRTKTGRPSTGAKAIKKLAGQKREEAFKIVTEDIRDDKGRLIIAAKKLNEARYPVVVLLEKYREYIKLMTAFYNRIEKGSVGARYFFWINQNGAESGRQSSPMHQLPKEIKGDIISDSSHHSIYDSDYSQIELRLTFSLAGEKVLIELCKDPDNDIHRAVDSGISGIEVWAISSDARQAGKSRNFGVVYLISGQGLAVQRHGASPSKDQIKQADDDLGIFFNTYKRIAKYIRDNRSKIEKEGKMRTFFGRTRFFDKIFDPDLPKEKKNTLIRQGNNHPVQGTAADIMKIAEVNMKRYIEAKGWDKLVETPEGSFPLVRVMISAHDEALVSGHYSIAPEEIFEMKKHCMELTIKEGMDENGKPIEFAPLFTSTGIIDNWKEGKEDAYQIPYRLRDRLIDNYKRTGVSCVNVELLDMGDGKVKPNLKEAMLKVINKYRDEELISYMESIVSEVGEDPSTVASKVTHSSLTHELISRFSQTPDHKDKNGKLGHVDHIAYSTERYFEFRKDPNFVAPELEKSDKDSEVDTKAYFEQIAGISEQLTYVDDKGEIHYVEDYEQEEEGLWHDDEMAYINAKTSGEVVRYWELFDTICVDTAGLTVPDCDDLLQVIYKYNDPKGFYQVKLFHAGKMVDTGIKVEKIDKKEILDFLEKRAPLISA